MSKCYLRSWSRQVVTVCRSQTLRWTLQARDDPSPDRVDQGRGKRTRDLINRVTSKSRPRQASSFLSRTNLRAPCREMQALSHAFKRGGASMSQSMLCSSACSSLQGILCSTKHVEVAMRGRPEKAHCRPRAPISQRWDPHHVGSHILRRCMAATTGRNFTR